MNIKAEDYRGIQLDSGELIPFPIDIAVEDGAPGEKNVTVAWIDHDGYLRFKTQDSTRMIFLKKEDGGVIG